MYYLYYLRLAALYKTVWSDYIHPPALILPPAPQRLIQPQQILPLCQPCPH